MIKPWLQKRETNLQLRVHKTQHRKIKIKQHEVHPKLGMVSGHPPGLTEIAPHVLTLLGIRKL